MTYTQVGGLNDPVAKSPLNWDQSQSKVFWAIAGKSFGVMASVILGCAAIGVGIYIATRVPSAKIKAASILGGLAVGGTTIITGSCIYGNGIHNANKYRKAKLNKLLHEFFKALDEKYSNNDSFFSKFSRMIAPHLKSMRQYNLITDTVGAELGKKITEIETLEKRISKYYSEYYYLIKHDTNDSKKIQTEGAGNEFGATYQELRDERDRLKAEFVTYCRTDVRNAMMRTNTNVL